MNRIFLIGLVLLVTAGFTGSMDAQKTILRGMLVDSLSLEGEPFATIRIFHPQSSAEPVAMTVTDVDGNFEQELLQKGEFNILFSSVGKANVTVPFSINGERTYDLGTVFTKEDATQLQGVEVVAQRPLVRMEVDRMSYSIADDVDSKTSTVLDMLRKVPMVTVDGNDNITVNGSSSFKVFVDGKPNVMMTNNPSTVFKNMPASSVKDIEIITNPGAKYDAEGVGGVLNLITDKVEGATNDMTGYNATFRGMGSTKGAGGGVYFSTQQGKLSMTVNGNIIHSKIKDMETTMDREQYSEAGNNLMEYMQSGNTTFNMRMGNFNMGYEFDSLRLLTASFGFMGFDTGSDGHHSTAMKGGVYGTGFGYMGRTDNDNDRTSINGGIDYQRSFAGHTDRTLTFSWLISTSPENGDNYSFFDGNSETSFLNLTDRYTDSYKNTLENTFQVDYSTVLGLGQTLDFGAKYILRDNKSDSKYYLYQENSFVFDPGNSLHYKHSNDILAGYAEYGFRQNRWSGKAGLRYEYTWQDVTYKSGQGTDFKTEYGNLVPSAHVGYKIHESQNIGLTYNMRISRPGIGLLNPFIDTSDPTSRSYGDPDLEPEKAHNISMVYNLFTPTWMVNLTLRQSVCNNAIEQFSFYEDNLLHTTYGNIVKNRQTGLNAYVNWNAGPKTRLMFNGGVTYVDLHSDILNRSNNGWQANGMVGLQQTLPWNIRLSANLMGSTKQYSLQGWNTGFNAAMASLSRTFLKDRLSVSISGVTNLSGHGLEFKSYAEGNDFTSHSVIRMPIRALNASVSYTFGKPLTVKKTKRSIQNTDVKDAQSPAQGVGTMIVQ